MLEFEKRQIDFMSMSKLKQLTKPIIYVLND